MNGRRYEVTTVCLDNVRLTGVHSVSAILGGGGEMAEIKMFDGSTVTRKGQPQISESGYEIAGISVSWRQI